MCRVISISNKKGGVGKSTSASSLGVRLARHGKKVLVIDADSQGSLTQSLGYRNPDRIETTLTTVLKKILLEEELEPGEGILHHEEGIDLMPCNQELATLEMSMVGTVSRETVLKRYIDTVKDAYDYILIDCMPSLGIMTINALTAADSVLIPVLAEYLPAKGLEELIKAIAMVKRHLNPRLQIEGILITMADFRTNNAKETSKKIHEEYGDYVRIFNQAVPKSVRAAESPAAGVSIFRYDPCGKVTAAYEALTGEVMAG